jgi:hypothetical protein
VERLNMPPKEEPYESSGEEYSDFVPAVFARNMQDAERYCELLEDHDIPAILGTEDEETEEKSLKKARTRRMTHGVPVLVPEVLLDEASIVIADREDIDEYEDEEEEDEEEEEEP